MDNGIMSTMLTGLKSWFSTFLKGRGTYTVAGLAIAWAAYGWLMGYIDTGAATAILTMAFSALGIRRNMPDSNSSMN